MRYSGKHVINDVPKKYWKLLLVRCIAGTLGFTCLVYSVKAIPLFISIIIFNTTPFIASILGYVVLGDKVSRTEIKLMVGCFVGVVALALAKGGLFHLRPPPPRHGGPGHHRFLKPFGGPGGIGHHLGNFGVMLYGEDRPPQHGPPPYHGPPPPFGADGCDDPPPPRHDGFGPGQRLHPPSFKGPPDMNCITTVEYIFGMSMMFTTAFCFSSIAVMTRKMKEIHFSLLMFHYGLFATVILGAILIIQFLIASHYDSLDPECPRFHLLCYDWK